MNIIEILLTDVPDASILRWQLFWLGVVVIALGAVLTFIFADILPAILGLVISVLLFVLAAIIPTDLHDASLADSVKTNLVSEGLMVLDINYPDSPTFTAVTFDGDIVVGTVAFTERLDGVLATVTYTNSITSKE